jgi:DNA-binding beta-propeller fold protein YncE
MKRFLMILVAALLILSEPLMVSAKEILPYDTYNYDYRGKAVSTPAAYIPSKTVFGEDLSCGSFKNPKDMFLTDDGNIYVADTGNNRIVVLNGDMEVLQIIDSFINNGKRDTFNSPSGVCCTDDGKLYIADTNNKRVIALDGSANLVKIINNPRSEVLSSGFDFVPLKVSVDYAGRVYVIASNVYQGIMAFNQDSEFMGYFGTIHVRITFIQKLWRLFSTKEQRARQLQYIPTEFTGLDIDDEGFVYATNLDSTGGKAVRMLNPKGIDVIRQNHNGVHTLGGDVKFRVGGDYQGASEIVDVKIRNSGIYSLLDCNRGRIFSYDSEGNLLYIFGGIGTQEGTFSQPVAMEAYQNLIYVLDASRNAIFVFEPTPYGSNINQAVGLRYNGDETKAVEVWKKVLELDSNNEMAYSGIGKAYLSSGENKKAMYYLKMGVNKEYYSIAYKRYRNELLRENLSWILTAILIGILLYCVSRRIIKSRVRRIV